MIISTLFGQFSELASNVRNDLAEMRRRGAKPAVMLDLSEQVIRLLLQLPAGESHDAHLSLEYLYRSDLLLVRGDTAGAISSLRSALEVQPNVEVRKALAIILSDLCERTTG